jgi:hypothetical protein
VSERVSPTMVRDILRTARDIMIERGLSQGAPARDHDGSSAARTDVAAREDDLGRERDHRRRAPPQRCEPRGERGRREVPRRGGAKSAPNPTWSVSDWADAEGRTAAQVRRGVQQGDREHVAPRFGAAVGT